MHTAGHPHIACGLALPIRCAPLSLLTGGHRCIARLSSIMRALVLVAVGGLFVLPASPSFATELAAASPQISYYREVRPILQANCQGCHQPAKAKGGYVMTDFKGFLAGGESEGTAVVPEHPDHSSILKMVTPQKGEARMPKGKSPLAASELALIATW